MHPRSHKEITLADDVLDLALVVLPFHHLQPAIVLRLQQPINSLACGDIAFSVGVFTIEHVRNEEDGSAFLLNKEPDQLRYKAVIVGLESEHVLPRVASHSQ